MGTWIGLCQSVASDVAQGFKYFGCNLWNDRVYDRKVVRLIILRT